MKITHQCFKFNPQATQPWSVDEAELVVTQMRSANVDCVKLSIQQNGEQDREVIVNRSELIAALTALQSKYADNRTTWQHPKGCSCMSCRYTGL